MRVVVTGGRTFSDAACVAAVLEALPITALAHGGATGADALADAWARARGLQPTPFAIDQSEWARLGRRAGPLRNGRMLRTFKPDLVVAFPGGRGTADCVRQARWLNIPVQEVPYAGD